MANKKVNKLKGFPRNYTVVAKKKKFNLYGFGPSMYEVFEVTGTNVDKPRYFVDEESVHKFIEKCELLKTEAKALTMKGYQHVTGVVSQHKEVMAAKDIADWELQTEVPNDRQVAKNPEDTDK